MKKLFNRTKKLIPFLAVALGVAACGSGLPGGMSLDPNFTQVERLARPAVNEGLIISNSNLNLWNSVGPSADLTPAGSGIVTEALGTLTAVINLAVNVFHALTGGNLWSVATFAQGTTTASALALVHGLQFVPDVMRIDVSDACTTTAGDPDVGGTAGDAHVAYIKCVNAATGLGPNPTGPLLAGGRKVRDNTVGITLSYLTFGASFVTQLFDGAPNLGSSDGAGGTGVTGVAENTSGSAKRYFVSDGYRYSTNRAAINGFPFLPAPYVSQ